MKKRKVLVVIISIVAIIGIGAGVGLYYLSTLEKFSYSYVPMTKSISEMASISSFIALVTPTGHVDEIAVNDHVSFILTEVMVESAIRGDATKGQIFKILGTKDVPIDIRLQNDNHYIVFVEPYVPGVKAALGCYVLTQAYKGVYHLDEKGNISQYDIYGQEELTGNRIVEVRDLLKDEIPILATELG